ncbi:hypothetical protein C8R47DRAFT_592592 [Mycena vitilis]|nr:hypothetical protein C8R47DRAFT_592592 [Mycena vitilis]
MHIKSSFPPLPPLPEVNVHHIMFGRPDQAEWPDYTIHIEANTGRKRTYKQMSARVGLGATALGSDGGLGLDGDGDEMVGLLGDNSWDYFDIVLSLLKVTTPFALISTYSTRFELVHALKLTKATRVFVDSKLLENVLAAIEDPDVHITADRIYTLSGPTAKARTSFGEMIDSVERKKVPLEAVRPAKKNTLAYLVMSSGTSGLPKAVMITHGNIITSTYQAILNGQIAESYSETRSMLRGFHPVNICPMPMFHSLGLNTYIIWATLRPATFVILEKWNTTQYLKAIAKYRVTHLSLAPSLVYQMVMHPDIERTDLSSVAALLAGGAYLPPMLAARLGNFLKPGSEISQGYGLSEATISVLMRPFEGMLGMGVPPPNTTGILLPGMEARIMRGDGTDANAGEVGELWLRGNNISPGYWNNPHANASTYIDGWLRTGDQFCADDKGYFFFVDRGKDTLKVSGMQVSPKEIEDVLLAHPDELISDVTVAGVSGGRTEDERVPRAWIVLSSAGKKKGTPAVIEVLDVWHQQCLSKYKWLRGGIEVVDEIPRTPTGKLMRRVLQDQYEQRAKEAKTKL